MRQSQLFYKTSKKLPKEAEIISHQLLVRSDFISQLASGVYSFLPLGCKVHQKIAQVIREELNVIGSQEVFLPALQPKELWQKTDRWDHMDPPIIKIKDRHDREFALGPTHEEVMTDLAKNRIQSYKDLPVALYQIQTKFRNELRFTGGLLRTREFVMQDLYSFHVDNKDLDVFFNKVLNAYGNIYRRCGLEAIRSEASGGVFTKEKTCEFQVLSETGEDRIFFCKKCKVAVNSEVMADGETRKCPECKGKLEKVSSIEVGHAFRLGTKYSQALGVNYIDSQGQKKPVVMGCYGIGIGRLMATVVEINHDAKGIVWPKEISPYLVHLIQIESNDKVKKSAEVIYNDLLKNNVEVLYDDRENKTAGEKFAEADLIGIPYRVVVSERTLEKDSVELKKRSESKAGLVKIESLLKSLK